MTYAPESFFLQQLFLHLNTTGIRYAVLRNYETLPFSAGGSDLDILVHPDDKKMVQTAVGVAIRKAGGIAIGYAEKKDFFTVGAFGRGGADANVWWGLLIDVYVELRYATTAQLVNMNVLSSGFALHNGIHVLPDDLAAALAVLKMLLHKDQLSTRYLAGLSNTTLQNWDSLWIDMSPIGRPSFQLLREICMMEPGSAAILPKSRALRKMILHEAFARAPWIYIYNRLNHSWFKIRRFLRPPSLVISLLGTDGAGKSTVITAIEPVLSAATHGAFIVKHLRPGLLPPLARLKGKQIQQDGPVTDPHGSNPSGWFGSLLRVSYLMADFIMGYWLIVRPKIAKSPTIYLFDRYAYDMALDPRRFRITLPDRVIRWFTRLAPKPDLIFCLYGNPQILAARKQELPLKEVSRQVGALKAFAATETHAILVSTETTVEDTRDQILNAIVKHCQKQTRNALHSD